MGPSEHRVRIYLTYLKYGVIDPSGTTPYKWKGQCTCGWGCLSWEWVATDRPGGALPMAIEHVTPEDLPTEP